MSKKRNHKESDLLNTETKPKIFFEIIEVSLWPPSSPDLKLLDYTILGVLENKTNATSYPNIGLFKTANEKEWHKMSEEFILNARKPFRRRVDIK